MLRVGGGELRHRGMRNRAERGGAELPSLAALSAFAGITTFTFCGYSEVVPVVLSFGPPQP